MIYFDDKDYINDYDVEYVNDYCLMIMMISSYCIDLLNI